MDATMSMTSGAFTMASAEPQESERRRDDGGLSAQELADLERWRERGLISDDQVRAINRYAETGQVDATPVSNSGRRFDIASIAYYFGGFTILFAYTIFMGLQWEAVGHGGQIGIAGFTIGLLWGLGALLRRHGFTLGGNLLVFAGTGIVPLLIYTIERVTGIWPGGDDAPYNAFFREVLPAWVIMELGAIAVAVAVVWRIRFSLVTLLIAFWTWYLSMDLVRWISGSDEWGFGSTGELVMSSAIGLGLIGLGVGLQRRLQEDFSFWFYLFGHLTFAGSFTALALDHKATLGLVVYPSVYLAVVVASVWLERKVFLVFGALGIYGYVSYLASEVFEGALGFTFGLALVGLVIILSAVGYQKYARNRLERFFDRHPLSRTTMGEAPAWA